MKKIYTALLGLAILLFSCNGGDHPNVANMPLELHVHDFYKDFNQLDTNNLEGSLASLKTKYPDYFNFFLDTLAMGTVGHEDGQTNLDGIRYFLTHKDYRSLMDTVELAFPNTQKITDDISTTLKLIKYYDSSFDVPSQLYYAVSGLSNMVVLGTKDDITVCLDFYLGPNYAPYYQIAIPDFLSRRFISTYIPINVAQAIYLDKHPFEAYGQDLLGMMIEQGKQQYFLSLVTPKATDDMRLGFSKAQLEWCNSNEKEIYNFFTTKNLLFNKDVHQVVRYVQDGPTASGMPQESPGNVGSFIGYSIIKSYMKETNASLPELLAEKDSKKILKLAKYKP